MHKKLTLRVSKCKARWRQKVLKANTWWTGKWIHRAGKEITPEGSEKERQPFWARVYLEREGIRVRLPSGSKIPQVPHLSLGKQWGQQQGHPYPVLGHSWPLRGHDHSQASPPPTTVIPTTNGELSLPHRGNKSSIQANDISKLLNTFLLNKLCSNNTLCQSLELEIYFTTLVRYIIHTLH